MLKPSEKFSKLIQPEKAYRYNVDSFLLMRFAELQKQDRVCDLGAGVGILGLLALEVYQVREVIAVELQQIMVDCAMQNAELFDFKQRFQILHDNWKSLSKHFPAASFDVVISNPPYRKIHTGRLPPNEEKAIARYEIHGSMQSLIEVASYLLKKEGRLYLIYPPLRLEELIVNLSAARLKIQRMSFVHAYQKEPAKLVMFEIVKAPEREIKIEAPVIVYRDAEHYQPEIEAWLGPKLKSI